MWILLLLLICNLMQSNCQFKEWYAQMYSSPSALPQMSKYQSWTLGKKSALLWELWDDEESIPGTFSMLADCVPWIKEFSKYYDTTDSVPKRMLIVQWWSVYLSLIIFLCFTNKAAGCRWMLNDYLHRHLLLANFWPSWLPQLAVRELFQQQELQLVKLTPAYYDYLAEWSHTTLQFMSFVAVVRQFGVQSLPNIIYILLLSTKAADLASTPILFDSCHNLLKQVIVNNLELVITRELKTVSARPWLNIILSDKGQCQNCSTQGCQ